MKAPERATENSPVKVVESQPAKTADLSQVTTSANVKAAHDEVEKQLAKLNEKPAEYHQSSANESTITMKKAGAAATADSHAASHEEPAGVDPEKALGWLKNGNRRFVSGRLRKDGQSATDIRRLSKGQKPHTIVLSCSDSRVPPEILFDQKLGEVFVVRTAGQSLDAMGIGSIEYALSHLGSRHILILGHTHCGAVKAACSTIDGGDAGSESLNELVKDLHPRLHEFKGKKEFSKGYVNEAWADSKGAALELANKSQIVNQMLQDKKIIISTAIYDIETGKVEFNR